MRRDYNPNTLSALRFENLLVELVHFGPVHFRPEMVFSVVAIVEPKQIVPLIVRAYAPGDRFIGIPAVMEKIAVQIRAAVSQVIKWEKVYPEFPIQNQADGYGRS